MTISDKTNKTSISQNKNKLFSEKTKRLLFYILTIAPLILQVCIFYIYVNISNISLSFLKYEQIIGVGTVSKFAGLENFRHVLNDLFSPDKIYMFRISFIMYGAVFFIATPFSIIFSFYIYKKFPLSGIFRTILFFPQIISTVVMSMMFRYLLNDVYMQITGAQFGLLNELNGSPSTILTCVIFYNVWMGFGANILLASGAMSGINESVVESCHLDGCNTIQEFIYITLPSIFPTITTFVIIDIAAIFSNQMNLYTFYGRSAPEGIWSIGYYLYVNTVASQGLTSVGGGNGLLLYPEISALGLMITLVILPLTFTVRKLFTKFGPSVD